MRGDEGRTNRQRALRIVLTVLAVGLGTVAVWLIVTSDNAQRTKIGALAGFWALLIAAYPVLGIRHPHQSVSGQELDVRPTGHLDRMEDAAQRLEYERRLQMMVRHEIQQALGSELSSLRSEVAALRSEILEKVGGQIRLERIETTRMIGSDIEALQHEVRQLKVGTRSDDVSGRFAVEASDLVQSVDDAVARQLAAAEAEHAARLQQITAQVAEVAPVVHDAPEPAGAAPMPSPPVEPQPEPSVAQQAEPEAREPAADGQFDDPFAAMPRLGRFDDLGAEGNDDDTGYAGRRRRPGDGPVLPGGRHAGGEADWATARPGGGRRHRDDTGQDILAEILRREGLRQ